jgi:hypothetical protein
MPKALDLIVFGATGFTGCLVAEHLNARYGVGGGVTWAMAGRSLSKLREVRRRIGADDDLPLLEADAADAASLGALVAQARAVVTTVGPYQLHGQALVTACAHAGTDYLDLCGEPVWMAQMIPRLPAPARASGARIVFSAACPCAVPPRRAGGPARPAAPRRNARRAPARPPGRRCWRRARPRGDRSSASHGTPSWPPSAAGCAGAVQRVQPVSRSALATRSGQPSRSRAWPPTGADSCPAATSIGLGLERAGSGLEPNQAHGVAAGLQLARARHHRHRVSEGRGPDLVADLRDRRAGLRRQHLIRLVSA